MRVQNYQIPKSSFLSVEKDMSIITDWMLKNKRLKIATLYCSKRNGIRAYKSRRQCSIN
jgi:hypothetical protein